MVCWIKIVWTQHNLGSTKKLGGHCPRILHVTTGLLKGGLAPQTPLAYALPRAHPASSITIHIVEGELACFVYLCHHPLHWLRFLPQALFIGPSHCMFIYFRSILSGLSRSCCGWPELKRIVRSSRRSLDFVRLRFTRVNPLDSELESEIKYCFKYTSYQI